MNYPGFLFHSLSWLHKTIPISLLLRPLYSFSVLTYYLVSMTNKCMHSSLVGQLNSYSYKLVGLLSCELLMSISVRPRGSSLKTDVNSFIH